MPNSPSLLNARNWRLRGLQMRTLADETEDNEPKVIMLRIANDYDRLADWAQKNALQFFPRVLSNHDA
jgi:hypothetical protein